MIPAAVTLDNILATVVAADWDATPLISWSGTELRRHRNLLYLMPPLPPLPAPRWEINWHDLSKPLSLPWGILTIVPTVGIGPIYDQVITVRLRQGGERCRLIGNVHRRPLKDLWQAAGIPPWERIRTPLLFLNGELAIVPGLGRCHSLLTQPGATDWEINWQPHHECNQ